MLMALASMQREAYQGFFFPRYHCELQFTGENAKSAEDGKDSNTNRDPKSQKVSWRKQITFITRESKRMLEL